MTFAEFIEMMRCKAIADFCNMSLLEVYEMSPEVRDEWWQQMREYTAHIQMLREGVASAKEQGADAYDYIRLLLDMEQGGQNAE